MRVGVYLDVRNPPPWARPWPEVHAWTLELVEQAEAWGADSAWTTEHHFFEDGYLPQPLLFAAALAARTRRLRLGTAVALAPLRPAVQLAEEAALLDVLSGGRFDLGLGAGYRAAEFTAYGADLATRYALLEQRADEVTALLRDGVVTPPPVQQPLPLWMGYMQPPGARRAGRRGAGLLCLDPPAVGAYLEGIAEGGHAEGTARVAGLVHAVVADDPEQAWAQVGPHAAYQLHSYARYHLEGTGIEPPEITPEALRGAATAAERPGIFPTFTIVTPDEAVALLRSLAPAGTPSEAFFFASIAGMPADVAARHVELLCTRVRPAVAGL